MNHIPVPDRAVLFGNSPDRRNAKELRYSYFYSFVNSIDNHWDALKGSNNYTGLGVALPAYGIVPVNIRLDTDCNYLFESIRFSAYTLTLAGISEWYLPVVGWTRDEFDNQIGTPLTDAIQVSVSTSVGDYIYGGQNNVNATLRPVGVMVTQGDDYSQVAVELPRIVPAGGLIKVELTNLSRYEITVSGVINGEKIVL